MILYTNIWYTNIWNSVWILILFFYFLSFKAETFIAKVLRKFEGFFSLIIDNLRNIVVWCKYLLALPLPHDTHSYTIVLGFHNLSLSSLIIIGNGKIWSINQSGRNMVTLHQILSPGNVLPWHFTFMSSSPSLLYLYKMFWTG